MNSQVERSERNRYRILLWVPLFGISQFIVCSVVAAGLYPGGSPLNPGLEDGFRFWENPISDLGRFAAWNGKPNHAASSIYTPSLIGLSFLILPLCVFLVDFTRRARFLFVLAAFFLALSAGLMLGVALTPYDLFLWDHDWFFTRWLIAFIALLLISLIGFVVRLFTHGFEFADWAMVFATLIVLICFIVQVVVPMIGGGLDFVIANQKVIACACIAWLAVVDLRLLFGEQVATASKAASKFVRRGYVFTTVAAVLGVVVSGYFVSQKMGDNRLPEVEVIAGRPLVLMFDSTVHNSTSNEGSFANNVVHLNGAMPLEDKITIEMWIFDGGTKELVCSRELGKDLGGIPIDDRIFFSRYPVFIAEAGSEEAGPDGNDETRLLLTHPPRDFKKKFTLISGAELERDRRYLVYCESSTTLVVSSDELDEIASDPEVQAMVLTVERTTRDAVAD